MVLNTPLKLFLIISIFYAYLETLILLVVQSSQQAITCSKLTIETLEQGVKYVQS